MRIGIDARFYGSNIGIGRYTQNLIFNLGKIDKKNQYIIFGGKRINKDIANFANFKFIKLTTRPYSLAEQIINPFIFHQAKLDLLHVPHFNVPLLYSGPMVVTIHDLIKHQSRGRQTTTRSPATYYFKYLAYRITFGFSVKKAKHIITPSQWTKNQLAKKYPQAKDKTSVIYEGVDRAIKKIKDRSLFKKISQEYSLPQSFLLYVGSLYPHKNIDALLGGVKILDQTGKGITLVIVSGRDVFLKRTQKKINRLGLEKRVKVLHKISNKKLSILYSNALALVFPSFLEGFGLPGLEAMACDCPVIASNSSCLPEIYGQAAEYFNPHQPKQIADKIKLLINNPAKKKILIDKGQRRQKQFNWQKNARETLKIYKNA